MVISQLLAITSVITIYAGQNTQTIVSLSCTRLGARNIWLF